MSDFEKEPTKAKFELPQPILNVTEDERVQRKQRSAAHFAKIGLPTIVGGELYLAPKDQTHQGEFDLSPEQQKLF
ncbi:MAG: hypothetical protein ACOH18_02755 [Candidatus Saccharimonadaceae bacterium]